MSEVLRFAGTWVFLSIIVFAIIAAAKEDERAPRRDLDKISLAVSIVVAGFATLLANHYL